MEVSTQFVEPDALTASVRNELIIEYRAGRAELLRVEKSP